MTTKSWDTMEGSERGDAALAAQDVAVDAMKAGEDEGAQWRQRQEADDVAVALDENCLPLPPGKEPWRIRDLSGLEWAFRQKAEADKEAAENLARAEVEVARLEMEIARLRERAASINAPLVKRAAFFESHIRVYAEQNRAEILGSGRRKSRKFLHGELAWRERKEGYYRKLPGAAAEADLLAWALKEEAEGRVDPSAEPLVNPSQELVVDLDRVKEYLETISTHCEGNGGVGHRVTAPGLEWVAPGETLEVKTVKS